MITKEKLSDILMNFQSHLIKEHTTNLTKLKTKLSSFSSSNAYIKQILFKLSSQVGNKILNFLSTGNINSKSGLGEK